MIALVCSRGMIGAAVIEVSGYYLGNILIFYGIWRNVFIEVFIQCYPRGGAGGASETAYLPEFAGGGIAEVYLEIPGDTGFNFPFVKGCH